ncbi:GntR family transcriptional regulator [Paenibacillus sp. MZ04-78.2]|uniref:GntR family transcriptional regulator n=1 Tax=Paenibacillus sp. MZ04-78.2 TaxID=2962034 RepID=UPI0020B865B7|nr:GntR family transcriptional regulator [Paenibacillus sp. MZ04-78.2]MCP3775773.1 GntR family transcriptional regulator [Paenibacillus sp. MZ04-78.2]
MNTKIPLYSQIQDYILQQIEKGHWPAHHQIPPEREIAEQFQVSRITAKNAMMGLVNDGFLYRHRGKGTFVAARNHNKQAKETTAPLFTAMQPSKKMIGFIMPWMEFQYSSLLISGVEAALSQLSYHLLFKRIKGREEESKAIQAFLDIPVDGIIIVACQGEQHFNDDIVKLILNKHHVVLVERTMRDIRTNGVYCNTKEIGTLMVEYLCKQEAKHIGLITYPSLYTIGVSDRINGFQSALVRMGREPLSEQSILSISPSILEELNRDVVPPEIMTFLQDNKELDAIAAVDALLAQYVGMACAKLNLKHIKIICCDQPLFHSDCLFPVAYIDQSPFEMGTIAARMIVDSIENQTEARKHMINPRLIEISQG